VTPDHPEGIIGAQVIALAIFLARTGSCKKEIKQEISARFFHDPNRTLDQIRPNYYFDASSQASVPETIIAFLESIDFEDAVRKAISLGGDSDTIACIAGGIAQAFYKSIPQEIVEDVSKRLPGEFLSILDEFNTAFGL